MAILEFPTFALQAQSARLIVAELVKHISLFGFTTYAIGTLPGRESPLQMPFLVENWPDTWKEAYFERDFGSRDPTLRALVTAAGPMAGSVSVADIRMGKAGFTPSTEELEVLDFAASIDRPHGLIIPIFGNQGYRGVVAFAGPGPDPELTTRLTLRFWGQIAHERLLSLHVNSAGGAGMELRLTSRELAILHYARQGLRDADISENLGIKIRTVRFHFENARLKLGAKTRAEAVAMAIGQDLIGS